MKYLVVFLGLILYLTTTPTMSVHAEVDSNVFVSDCLNDREDCEDDRKSETITESDTPATEPKDEKAPLGSSVGDYIQTLFALVFVIGLLYGLMKFINRKNRLYNKNRLMKNMGGISLGQQKSIQLVVIGEAYYLIGVGDDIRLLKEITDPEEINKLSDFYDDESKNYSSGMMDRVLMKLSGSLKRNQRDSTEEPTNFSTVFNTSLDEMKEERKRQLSRLTEKERNRDE